MEDIPHLPIDLAQILDVAHVGARRASAFVAIAATREPDPKQLTDFSLGARHKHTFWPTPVPSDVAAGVLEEFDSWTLAASLRELHAHFELFLNQVWNWANAVEKFGARLPSDLILEDTDFRDISSVRTKLIKMNQLLPVEPRWLECLSSMHFARNSLSHGAGFVRKRDCNNDGVSLNICWTGMDVYLKDGDKKIEIEEAIRDQYVVSSSGGVVVAEVVNREISFYVGQKITISNQNLAEICTFYTGVAGMICMRLLDFFEKKGVPVVRH